MSVTDLEEYARSMADSGVGVVEWGTEDILEVFDRLHRAEHSVRRVVSTMDELDELLDGSVVKSLIGGEPRGRTWGKVEGDWWGVALECPDFPILPAAVIYEGGRNEY